MKKSLIKKVGVFEIHHKIIFFILIVLLTIAITRGVTQVKDSTPIVRGFELHHFDYGIILLIITTLLMLFGNNKKNIYLVLSGISIGWIIDELWFIRKNTFISPLLNETAVYNSTYLSSVLGTIILILLIFLINYFIKKSKSIK